MPERLVLAAVALSAFSGVPGLFMDRKSAAGQKWALAFLWAGAICGLFGAVLGFTSTEAGLTLPWAIPGGRFSVRVDAVSSLFLLPVFLIPPLCALYGLSYWPQVRHPENGTRLSFFFGLVPAGMGLLLIARNSLLFLLAWEVMTLAAFFLVSTEDEKPSVREAGWHYLVATHVGVLALMALFALLRRATGSFELGPVAPGAFAGWELSAVFLLGVVGFGLKAGIVPFHVWLPGAHANAPTHVSAILSGVLLKMGVYGLVRLIGWLPVPPVWWGEFLLAAGMVSGIMGVLYALGQHDLKRLLAYHSIENIGIIVMGLGIAALGRSLGRNEWVALGLSGGLLHVINHSLFKSLLFLSAGSVIDKTRTREIDRLGGLSKAMPLTALAFLIGAVAICGLPPLNGFVSELLIYLGLFHAALPGDGTTWAGPAFVAPALALTGALAVACFVKVYGTVFLGEPRTEATREAEESSGTMLIPLAVLSAACVAIGLWPAWLTGALDRVVACWQEGGAPTASLEDIAPLPAVGLANLSLVALAAIGLIWMRNRMKRGPLVRTVTWDCGYASPTARMQYTASSFAQMLVDFFSWVLVPRKRGPKIEAFFPETARFHGEVPDLVLDRLMVPAWKWIEETAGRFKVLQQGLMQVYVLYILATVVALMFWW